MTRDQRIRRQLKIDMLIAKKHKEADDEIARLKKENQDLRFLLSASNTAPPRSRVAGAGGSK